VSFAYDNPPDNGSIRQGEILGPLWEHRPLTPPTKLEPGAEVPVQPVEHAVMVVLTPDCDLLWDFNARFVDEEARVALGPESEAIATANAAVPHVLLCDAYDGVVVRSRFDAKLFKLASQNRDERYHYFPEAAVGDSGETLPEMFLDFKKPLAIPTNLLYEGLRIGGVRRLGWLPLVYRHDLIHRFFSFQSRIATPGPGAT